MTECLGDSRYKVRSLLSHAVFTVDQSDLYDPTGDSMFEAGSFPIDEAGIANLF